MVLSTSGWSQSVRQTTPGVVEIIVDENSNFTVASGNRLMAFEVADPNGLSQYVYDSITPYFMVFPTFQNAYPNPSSIFELKVVNNKVTNPNGNLVVELYIKDNVVLDYEVFKFYTFYIGFKDRGNLAIRSKEIRFQIKDMDELKDITLSNDTVLENSPVGTLVGDLTNTFPWSNTYTWSLLDDANGKFYVQNSKVYVNHNANLDYETKSSYTIKVRCTIFRLSWNTNQYVTVPLDKDFIINVADGNDAPTAIVIK